MRDRALPFGVSCDFTGPRDVWLRHGRAWKGTRGGRLNRLWVRGHLRVTASGRFLPVPTDRNRPKAALREGRIMAKSRLPALYK